MWECVLFQAINSYIRSHHKQLAVYNLVLVSKYPISEGLIALKRIVRC